jgi:tetratricopeptide (TPR) repeat protein
VIPALTIGLSAQSGTATGRGSNNPNTIPMAAPDVGPRSLFMVGKVKVDDGTPLSDPAAIRSTCQGSIRTAGFTDSEGRFSFEISNLLDNGIATDQVSDSSAPLLGQAPTETARSANLSRLRDFWRGCTLEAVLPGFTSEAVELADKSASGLGTTDVGTIVLHRQAQVQGFTISTTSARAPAKARKEYEKARESEEKAKWDDALASLHQAVKLYPDYAVAWLEMGRIQIQKEQLTEARDSLHHALSADPKFVSPYHELAQLAGRARQWQEMADMTDALLKLNPINFPQDWLLNAIANFYLQHLDVAEKSAVRGLELDPQHQAPRLDYVLGMILAQKHDYATALPHLQNYLRLSPAAPDGPAIRKQIEELEHLSTTTVDQ